MCECFTLSLSMTSLSLLIVLSLSLALSLCVYKYMFIFIVLFPSPPPFIIYLQIKSAQELAAEELRECTFQAHTFKSTLYSQKDTRRPTRGFFFFQKHHATEFSLYNVCVCLCVCVCVCTSLATIATSLLSANLKTLETR